MLEKIITQKTAKDIITTLLSDQDNIDIDSFKSVYNIAKPFLSKGFILSLFSNIKNTEYINFFSSSIKMDMLNVFQQSKDIFLKKYPPFPNNKLILVSIFDSELPESFKKEYFNRFFNKINYVDHSLMPIIKKIYIKYEFKITNDKIALLHLNTDNKMIHTVADLFEHDKFIENVQQFNALDKIKILINLTKDKFITLDTFEKIVIKPCFDNLLINNFPLGSFEINDKALTMYQYFNIDFKEKLKKEGVESFLHLKNKNKKFIAFKLEKNSTIFTEKEVLTLKGKLPDSIDSETWINLKPMINYQNKEVSENENFLYLTQKTFPKPNKSIAQFLIQLEKQVFEEKIEDGPVKNKLKI